MSLAETDILDALRQVPYPGFARDLVSLGVVREVRVAGDRVEIDLVLSTPDPALGDSIVALARGAVAAVPGAGTVIVRPLPTPGAGAPSLRLVGSRPPSSVAAAGALDERLVPGVRNLVAVASGKGGVGKSTVAANLAVALGRRGLRVGLLDADVYGPSVPLMFGLQGEHPRLDPATRRLVPFERFGVRLMSIGFLADPQVAVIWRGPMVMKALEQLLREVSWGELDVLVVDMPPGTGDAQLTMAQRARLAGAVIVTTPQDVALADAIKGVDMFRKVAVEVLGLVENMSFFECPHCRGRSDVFGHGGGRAAAERLGVPFLGEIPLEPALRESGDAGHPIAAGEVAGASAAAFHDLAARVAAALGLEASSPETDGGGFFERFRRAWKRGPASDEP